MSTMATTPAAAATSRITSCCTQLRGSSLISGGSHTPAGIGGFTHTRCGTPAANTESVTAPYAVTMRAR